jgi:thioredoxin 1
VDKNPQAAVAYQVRGVPTLILFKKGKILWRQSGVVSASELEKLIKANS